MAEQMKPTGIDWIGDIPVSWSISRLKFMLANEEDSLKVGPFGSSLSGTDYIQEGKWVFNQRVVLDNNFIDNDTCISDEKFQEMKSFSVYPEDILITTRGTIGKVTIVPQNAPQGILHPCIIKFRLNKKLLLPELLKLLFNETSYAQEQFAFMNNSTTIDVIYSYSLKDIILPLIPINEQKAIYAFLHKECDQIDSIAADLGKQIELLQKYKKSLITETVTKGLDKSVPMKDSGIDWIGEIPAHWNVEPIKYRVTFHNGDRGENYPSKTEVQSEGIPFINAGHLDGDGVNMDNMDYISEEKYRVMGGVKLRSGDILYCLRGSVGKNAIVDMNQGTVASSLVAIRSERISAEYLYYCLNSHIEEVQRYLWDNGTAQPNLSADNLGKYKICIPPDEEQMTIVKYLNNICSQIDNLIIGKKEQLSTIQQHKKSLVYEYVTGKKRVKEAQ